MSLLSLMSLVLHTVEVEPEILKCEEGCSTSSIDSLIFDDYLKAEIILLFFSILNFDRIKLIGFNQFTFKCQRSLDGSILLPEFSGICITVVVCCFNSGSLPELKFTYGMNFSPGRGVLYNSQTHQELQTSFKVHSNIRIFINVIK